MFPLVRMFNLGSEIELIGFRRISLVLSALLVLASVGLYLGVGLNLGVDFSGGIKVAARFEENPAGKDIPVDLTQLRADVEQLNLGAVSIQSYGRPTDVLITLPVQEGNDNANNNAKLALKTLIDGQVKEYLSEEVVGPTVSAELFRDGIWATVLALLAIAAYVGFRFEWRFAIGALVALSHDVITTIGLFCLLQLEFNLATVAAILAIAGYSINDTVVVFDRVREEIRKYKQMEVAQILNLALNRTLARTVVTSVTTLLALIALLAFGGPVIRDFSIALIWGVVIGTYSSIFLATPMLLLFRLRKEALEKSDSSNDGEAALLKQLASKSDN